MDSGPAYHDEHRAQVAAEQPLETPLKPAVRQGVIAGPGLRALGLRPGPGRLNLGLELLQQRRPVGPPAAGVFLKDRFAASGA